MEIIVNYKELLLQDIFGWGDNSVLGMQEGKTCVGSSDPAEKAEQSGVCLSSGRLRQANLWGLLVTQPSLIERVCLTKLKEQAVENI